jgi:uncharacterized protein YfkK (UPF0435 family)
MLLRSVDLLREGPWTALAFQRAKGDATGEGACRTVGEKRMCLTLLKDIKAVFDTYAEKSQQIKALALLTVPTAPSVGGTRRQRRLRRTRRRTQRGRGLCTSKHCLPTNLPQTRRNNNTKTLEELERETQNIVARSRMLNVGVLTSKKSKSNLNRELEDLDRMFDALTFNNLA